MEKDTRFFETGGGPNSSRQLPPNRGHQECGEQPRGGDGWSTGHEASYDQCDEIGGKAPSRGFDGQFQTCDKTIIDSRCLKIERSRNTFI